MPLVYKPSGAPGTRLGEEILTREVLERIAKGIEEQNKLLEKLVKPGKTPQKTGKK